MIHRIVSEWDDEMDLVCIYAECPCAHCTERVKIVAVIEEHLCDNVEIP